MGRPIRLPDLDVDRVRVVTHAVRDQALAAIRNAGPLTTRQVAEHIGWPTTAQKIRQLRTLLEALEYVRLVEVDRPVCNGRGRQNTYRAVA